MKIVLAYFFIIIFSIQVMPVKEIGQMLFKGTMTEEIHETGCDADDMENEVKKENDPYTSYKHAPYYNNNLLVLTSNGLKVSTAVHAPKQYIPDIPTPPPNAA